MGFKLCRNLFYRRLNDHARVRVMIVIEGQVMARLPGCIPWVMSEKMFRLTHRPERATDFNGWRGA